MASRNRDDIFELVVLKEKNNEPAGNTQDAGFEHKFSTTERGHVRNGEETDDRKASRVDAKGEGKVKLPNSNDYENCHSSPQVSYGNAMHEPGSFKDEKGPCTSKLALCVIFMGLVTTLLLGLIIVGVAMASVNNSQLAKLKQARAVDRVTNEATVRDYQAMLGEMSAQIVLLNFTVAELTQRLELADQRLNLTRSALDDNIDFTQGKIVIQSDMLMEVFSRFNDSLVVDDQRFDSLEESRQSSNLRVMALETQTANLTREIVTLQASVSTPVDVFRSCSSETMNSTREFSSEDFPPLYRVETQPVNFTEMDAVRILDTRCQLLITTTSTPQSSVASSSYLETHPGGGVGCVCTVAPPLTMNGTHAFDEEGFNVTISCQMYFTTCPLSQQLYSLV